MTVVRELKAEERKQHDSDEKPSAMYNSASEYQERMRSHKLLDELPKSKYNQPLTTNMSVGWAKVDYNKVQKDILPKRSCAETLYADAMVKAGVYYY